MAGHSIGDRVEVRWQAGLFAAKVFRMHSAGSVDAVYDIDGSTGVFLTVKEHGLKVLGDQEKKGEGKGKKKITAGSPARSMAAPPRHKHGGCATSTGVVLQTRRFRQVSARRLHRPPPQ